MSDAAASTPPPDPMVDAIRAAVERAPDDPHLRAHLVELLIETGKPDEAIVEARHVLAVVPDMVRALRAAAIASEQLGELSTATSYWRIVDALGNDGTSVAPAAASIDRTILTSDETAPSDAPSIELEVATGGLETVGGMAEVKARLEAMFLAPLLNPALREMYGTSLRGGLLLYGPPGCGKTYIARALAGELGTRFVHVGLNEVLDMWIGNSEKNVHEVFAEARRQAPTLLFLDELDALGASRAKMTSGSAMRNVIAQLLVELDGVSEDNDGVFVLGATNQPWDVDPALRRPGRFDRTLFVAPPDDDARVEILRRHFEGRPMADDVDPLPLVAPTRGFSGADLAAVVNDAAQAALMDSVESGSVRPIAMSDLVHAMRDRTPSTGPWMDVARNVVTFANRNGEYAELADFLDGRKRRR